MKYFNLIASSLILNLVHVTAQEIKPLTNDYLQSSIEESLTQIGQWEANEENSTNTLLNETHLRAPNSYIFDVDYAKSHGFSGLKIPVKKAFEIWANQNWHLNSPLPSNGTLSAYLYWEEINGLIQSVQIENGGVPADSKINVQINEMKGEGNALISLHWGSTGTAEDDVIWSWHVWVTDDPSNGVAYGQDMETDLNGNLFTPQYMDRNLGAVSNEILGHNWHKTTGMLYQWGRKDPIPPMMTKDHSFYELNGLVGYMRNREGIHSGNILPEIMRPFSDISSNMKFSVQNPIAYIINSDSGTWFSEQQYRIPDNPNTNQNETVAWDLWSDNMRGENSNPSSSDPVVKADSRSYELKSPYDPCPNGWRIPSHLGRNTVNNSHSPWGRKNSGYNDDIIPANNMFYPDQPNNMVLDVKVYSGIGVDFRDAHDSNNVSRNIGAFPTTGYYVYYPNNGNPSIVFQDSRAIAALWTATYSLGGARYFRVVTDPIRPDLSEYGLNQVMINQTSFSMEGMPVRCMRDPNLEIIGNFETEYATAPQTHFTQGLYNPNTYLIEGDTEILIPVNKAFAAQEYLFPFEADLPADQLIATVLWTDNSNMVQTVKVIDTQSDKRTNSIRVSLNPNQKGNALISLHNGSIENPVYWSWHLWNPADPINQITYVNQNVLDANYNFINAMGSDDPPLTTHFMDRNLGAIHDLPIEALTHPEMEEIQNEIKLSGGFHYQWGRKDPIPSFKHVGGENYEIFKGVSVNEAGVVTYQSINAAQYQNEYTEAYSEYKQNANVSSSDNKYQEASKIISYSVKNPLTLLHKETTNSSDWVSSELAVAPNRWGHSERKSVYDPCPKDWRVPDTFKVWENGKGNSPWYNGKKLGSSQGTAHYIGSNYGGQFKSFDNKAIGWYFTDDDYQIGHFPASGIIGKFSPGQLSGTSVSQAQTGVWTSALTQQLKGHALAMSMGALVDADHRVIATGNISPSYALNVRCARDERRYSGDLGEDYFEMDVRDFSNHSSLKDVKFFPNPVRDYLNTSSDKNFQVELYDLQGKLVWKGNFENKKINLTPLPKGVYIALMVDPNSTDTLQQKIIKN
jgi:hypothetical protein